MDYSAWGVSWLGAWGNSWGPLHQVEEEPQRYRKLVQSVSGGDQGNKIHLAELYSRKQILKDIQKENWIMQQNADLISIIAFMISSELIT